MSWSQLQQLACDHKTCPDRYEHLQFLDGLRGWAAVIVCLYHLIYFLVSTLSTFYRQPVFVIVLNGPLAVYIFFIISGFALSLKFIRHPGRYSVMEAIISRYFRLCLPIFFTTFITYLCLKNGLAANVNLGEAIKAHWLANRLNETPLLKTVFSYSFYYVFAGHGHIHYNSSLWTMSTEIRGSLVIFFLALIGRFSRGKQIIGMIPVSAIMATLLWYMPAISCFLIGYILAWLHDKPQMYQKTIQWLATIAILIPVTILATHRVKEMNNLIGIAFLIVACACFPPYLRAFFSSRLSVFLGAISFPLYLIHLLILCCFSCPLYIYLMDAHYDRRLAAHIIVFLSLGFTLLVSYLLLPVERFSISAGKIMAQTIIKFAANHKHH